MFNFLHTFNPLPILATIGPINIYWYGLFIILGVLVAITVAIYLAKLHNIKSEAIIDLAVWLIVGGLIGARLYDIFLEWPYFSAHPLDIIKIWQGGLAIHGAIVGGCLALYLFIKKYQHSFWQLAAIIATVLPLGQAIGRWGNYFNQELFGYPTDLPWGIPIEVIRRPFEYLNYNYFHPAFLYESIGDLMIFLILLYLQIRLIKKSFGPELSVIVYAILYSLLRFSTEFIRIDATPVVFGLRFPQLASLLIILSALVFFTLKTWPKISQNQALDN